MTNRQRLDIVLEQRGLLPSRARARDAILRGTVSVNGTKASKPHQKVSDDDKIALSDPAAPYVSRSALKLIAGLDEGKISIVGKTCLDVGASTGGFTQVLIERGAQKVYAVDVGHEQLHETLRTNARVTSLEGTNARDLTTDIIPDPIDILTCDISFVSVEKVLELPLSMCGEKSNAIILIKPQFEVGREFVGRGGIVTDQEIIDLTIARVIGFVERQGFDLLHQLPSPLSGGDGNLEVVSVFARRS